jgi:hypothetical protein
VAAVDAPATGPPQALTEGEQAALRTMRRRLAQGALAARRLGYEVLDVNTSGARDLVLAWDPARWEVRGLVVDGTGRVVADVPEGELWTG